MIIKWNDQKTDSALTGFQHDAWMFTWSTHRTPWTLPLEQHWRHTQYHAATGWQGITIEIWRIVHTSFFVVHSRTSVPDVFRSLSAAKVLSWKKTNFWEKDSSISNLKFEEFRIFVDIPNLGRRGRSSERRHPLLGKKWKSNVKKRNSFPLYLPISLALRNCKLTHGKLDFALAVHHLPTWAPDEGHPKGMCSRAKFQPISHYNSSYQYRRCIAIGLDIWMLYLGIDLISPTHFSFSSAICNQTNRLHLTKKRHRIYNITGKLTELKATVPFRERQLVICCG